MEYLLITGGINRVLKILSLIKSKGKASLSVTIALEETLMEEENTIFTKLSIRYIKLGKNNFPLPCLPLAGPMKIMGNNKGKSSLKIK